MKNAIIGLIAAPGGIGLVVWGLRAYVAKKRVDAIRERRRTP